MTTLARFVTRQSVAILFLTAIVCLAGAWAGWTMPTSVFPQTDFPRVVILVDSGVIPAEQMMALVTRPIEEAMNDIPGVDSIRTTTSRGSAEINVFFNWSTDMEKSLLYVQGRLAQLAPSLPAEATFQTFRLTFSAFPIIGLSVTSPKHSAAELWELAQYTIKPRLIRTKDVARVDLVGGRVREYHIQVDPVKLEAHRLTLPQVAEALKKTNQIGSAGLLDENHQLYLALVGQLARNAEQISDLVIGEDNKAPVHVRDIGSVTPGVRPQYNVVTADGRESVLLNIRSQPYASTVDVAEGLKVELERMKRELPPDVAIAFFYDQSLLVRASIVSVWESIIVGLILSVIILVLFLRSWGTTLVATLVIPVSVLVTLVVMKLMGMTFNLMTLGGIAAAIGLIIDDAIVVVENIYTHVAAGMERRTAIETAVAEIAAPIVGSTLTPVVVFLPLAFLEGVTGVFFRALALTMVSALLTSLVLALTLTPTVALRFVRTGGAGDHNSNPRAGRWFGKVIRIYERALKPALARPWGAIGFSVIVLVGSFVLYQAAESDFMPSQDEGAFVLDYFMPPGTSLSETDRVLRHVEQLLRSTPEVESYSRRTGARLALAIAEPNTGDFLVRLKAKRSRGVEDVTDDLRQQIEHSEPALHVSFAGILNDLIGDLTWSPAPIEIRLYSKDFAQLREKAAEIAKVIEGVPGVVDVFDGVVVTGPAVTLIPDREKLATLGMTVDDLTRIVQTAAYGNAASFVIEGDRQVSVRVLLPPGERNSLETIRRLLVRAPTGAALPVSALAKVEIESGQTELRRLDLRQMVAVSARLSGRDLGGAISDIQRTLAAKVKLPAGVSLEYGGLYEQQQASFRNLLGVLAAAVLLVFLVLVLEFRSFRHAVAIVWGALLSLFGVLLALKLTGTTLNIISFMGAIIGIGIVAKNGILLLDAVDHHLDEGMSLRDALAQSGARRLRPVVMTSLAAALGMLPLALGLTTGAQMLKPLAIAVIGGLAISVLLSLVVTPAVFLVLSGREAERGSTPTDVRPLADENASVTQ
jgi:CzcA family heavy metal efflux pump